MVWPPAHGGIAPSRRVLSGSGIDQLRVDLLLGAQAGALRAGAVGRVEGEDPGLQVLDGQRVVVGAGQVLGELALAVLVVLGQVDEVEQHDAAGEPERGLDRVGEPLLGARLDREPVDHHLDGVLLLLLELRRLGQRVHHAVDPGPREALGLQLGEEVDILALAAADHRGEHLEPGALRHREHPVDDLLRGLLADQLAADRAVRLADPGEEQPQVVVDLGDRADGRARVARGRLLVDRDRRGQALDEVDVGLVHLAEELPRVRRQRLDVAPLALGEDRVEGEARLARAGQPGEHDHRVARQVEADVAQVVLARATDDQSVGHGASLTAGYDKTLRPAIRGRAVRSTTGFHPGDPDMVESALCPTPCPTLRAGRASAEPEGPIKLTEPDGKKPPRFRRLLYVVSILTGLVLLLCGGIAGGLWLYAGSIEDKIDRVDAFTGIPEAARPSKITPQAMNILLLGSDSRANRIEPDGKDTGARSDTIIVVHLPADRQNAQLISIPRDTWASIPEHGKAKINAGYALGGTPLTVRTVEEFTKVRIDHVVLIDFAGFKEVIDAIGGIEIVVDKTFKSIHAPVPHLQGRRPAPQRRGGAGLLAPAVPVHRRRLPQDREPAAGDQGRDGEGRITRPADRRGQAQRLRPGHGRLADRRPRAVGLRSRARAAPPAKRRP